MLAIDIETFSSVDLKKSGLYKYVASEDFEILLFAYSLNRAPVEVIDLTDACDAIPEDVIHAIKNPNILKTAWNAAFERTALAKYFGVPMPPGQWECSMAKAALLGLPLSLDQAGKALKLEQGKDNAGKALIRYFTVPCKPTIANGLRIRNLPEHDVEKWQQFIEYNRRDVETELAIREKISFFNIPEIEKKVWRLDQKINDSGIMMDRVLVKNAIRIDLDNRDRLTAEAIKLTNLDNPNSAAQLKQWLSVETGEEVTGLKKEDIPVLLANTDSKIVSRVLTIRSEMAKTSIKKYAAMIHTMAKDKRARGLFQYAGASRTARWAGRLIQLQNLPRIYMKDVDLDIAREYVKTGNAEMLELFFENVPNTLSELIRTAFIAPEGHRFLVADFSSIELVVAAWLAGEKWVLDEFMGARKIYEQTAARMLHVVVESISKDSPERQKGKIASLSCQFGGGVNALKKMGAVRMGIPEEELPGIISMWRAANRNIVRYWKTVEEAAITAVKENATVKVAPGLKFYKKNNFLFIELPSGRCLSYCNPKLIAGKFGGDALTYEGMDQTTKQWCKQHTWGGKIFENITQGIARDCLADAMLRIDNAGYKIAAHVHDEVVSEMPDEEGSLDELYEIMSTPIPWAKGLPLAAAGFENNYYKK